MRVDSSRIDIAEKRRMSIEWKEEVSHSEWSSYFISEYEARGECFQTWVYLWSINSLIRPTKWRAHILYIYDVSAQNECFCQWAFLFILISFDDIDVFTSMHAIWGTHTHSHPSISMYRNLLPEIYIAILGYYLSLKCDPRYVLYDDGISLRRLKKQKYNKIFGTKLQKHLTNGRRENRNEQTNETKRNGMEYTKNQWSSLSPPFDHNTRTI